MRTTASRARQAQARTKLALERLQKAWCDELLAPEGAARDRASIDYLVCLATEAPHVDDRDLAIKIVRASALPAASQRTMFATALAALSAHEPAALARAGRAVFCAVGTSIPTALGLVFDAARTLPPANQGVLMNE